MTAFRAHLAAAAVGFREGVRAYRDEFVLRSSAELFWRALKNATAIEGFTSPIELSLLYHLARSVEGDGVVVEIGSYLGRSTVALAQASIDAGREPVIAVDPHIGILRTNEDPEEETLERFLSNITRAGVAPSVRVVHMMSVDAARCWAGEPIRMLFIDGLHTCEAVLADFRAWAPWLTHESCVVFDDYLTSAGVRQAVIQLRKAHAISGAALVTGKMIAFGPEPLLAKMPVPPGARLLAHLPERALMGFNRLFCDQSLLGQ